MDYIDIFGLICFVGLIYSYGFIRGMIFFIFLGLIGVFLGLLSEGYFWGDIGRYLFLIIIIPIGIIVNVKKFREYAKQKISVFFNNLKKEEK